MNLNQLITISLVFRMSSDGATHGPTLTGKLTLNQVINHQSSKQQSQSPLNTRFVTHSCLFELSSKVEQFIRSKYDSRRWAMDGPLPDPETLDVEGVSNQLEIHSHGLHNSSLT